MNDCDCNANILSLYAKVNELVKQGDIRNDSTMKLYEKYNELIQQNNAYDSHIKNIINDQFTINQAAERLQKGFIALGTKLNEIINHMLEEKE